MYLMYSTYVSSTYFMGTKNVGIITKGKYKKIRLNAK